MVGRGEEEEWIRLEGEGRRGRRRRKVGGGRRRKGFRRAASKTIFNAHGIENAHMPCTCRQGRVKLTLFAK